MMCMLRMYSICCVLFCEYRSNPEYVVLYYPSISLFFNGTIAKRFDPSKSFEELKSLISGVTGNHFTFCYIFIFTTD